MSLFNELKRRNVFKVGIAYVIVAWLVAQVLQLVFESFGTPAWAIKTVLVLLATGLPFALFFAWAFELTPDGIKREHEVDRSQSIAPQTSGKLNRMITVVLVLALAYFAVDKFVISAGREAALVEAATQTITEQPPAADAPTETFKSIAVLPFVNMSSDPEQEYFSDGISEELLNVLARIEQLKVAARTSSFSFKGQNRPVAEIAQVLDVDHILEGSVRKSGSQIRITAQLIRVSDGFHMWSDTYDRELVNIFAIQDEITEAIVKELRVELDVQEQIISTTSSPEAYQEYLQGRYFWSLRATQNMYRAIEHFEHAVQLDPFYEDAWLGLAETYVLLPIWEFDHAKVPQQLEQARMAANKALALNPNSGRAYAVLGQTHGQNLEWPESRHNYDLAVQHAPEYATAWAWRSGNANPIGLTDLAAEGFEKALALEPHSRIIGANAAEFHMFHGQNDVALKRIDATLAFAPDFRFGWMVKGMIHVARNEFDQARTAFRKMPDASEQKSFDMRTVDAIEHFVRTGTPGELPDSLFDPEILDQYYPPIVMVYAGQYERALDQIEQGAAGNIPFGMVFYLRSKLYQERMGHMPRYQALVKRLATFEPEEN